MRMYVFVYMNSLLPKIQVLQMLTHHNNKQTFIFRFQATRLLQL